MTSVTHKLNISQLNYILKSQNGPVARDLIKRGARVQTRAKRNLGGGTGSGPKRIDTGLLRSTIFSELVVVNGDLRARIGSRVFYAYWIHEGTGLYGPKHARIFPRRARTLAWKNKVYGAKKGKYAGWVFAKSTKGMRPNRFLTKALPSASLRQSG